MKFKPRIVIIFFLILWMVFIGWGIVRTTLHLTRQEEAFFKEAAWQSQKPEAPGAALPGQKSPSGKTVVRKTGEEKPPQETKPVPILVRTFRAHGIDFTDVLPVMGTVKGKTEIDLKFEIEGNILSINFREGDRVGKGELIARLDPKDAQLKLEYVKNKLSSAQAAYQANLKRLEVHQQLYDAGAIVKSKLEEIELECERSKFEWETIKSERELAENELKKTNLFAAMDGIMGPLEAEEGEFVTPQDKLGSLLQISCVLVEVGIVERDIHKIKVGQKANVFVDAYPDIAFEGFVENIFPVVEGKSRTLTARIQVDNPEGKLLPGMFCRADVVIVELEKALIIPSTALITAGAQTRLVAVIPAETIESGEGGIQTGIIKLCRVGLGYLTSDYVQITEGINEGDLAVIEAQGELKDNAMVRISSIEEPSF